VSPHIPAGYPSRLSDEELAAALSEMFDNLTVRSLPFENILPELQLATIQAGLLEQARRAATDAEKLSRRSLIVAVLALVATAVGVITSIVIAAAG
jgi:hypothetical protein